MKNINRFVLQDKNKFVNITNKKILPVDSSDQELEDSKFLVGQELECIEDHLFRRPARFEIKLITTWRCNLRCSHCFVLHQLVKKDPGSIDVDKLCGFLDAYLDEFDTVKGGRIQFVGGESALTARHNIEVMDRVEELCERKGRKIRFHSNTNGFDLDEDIIEYYKRLTNLTISLDGPKHLHDAQRKSADSEDSPFDRTVSNVRKLVELGMRDKVRVQSAVSDEGMNRECITSFYKTLLMNGVKFENISYNVSVPTKWHDPGERFKDSQRNPMPIPCCKFRWMADFTVCTDNNIYCDYFDVTEGNRIGSLSDPVKEIAEQHKKAIREKLPVLHDPKCQQCPVLGICWGHCCNLHGIYKPSDLCDAEGLYKRAQEAAEKGALVEFMMGSHKAVPTCRTK